MLFACYLFAFYLPFCIVGVFLLYIFNTKLNIYFCGIVSWLACSLTDTDTDTELYQVPPHWW